MPQPTFVAYIDESGDEGFRFDVGSKRWFVLSALVCLKAEDLAVVDLAKAIRVTLGKAPNHELHFKKLKHDHRVLLVNELAKSGFCAVSVLIHKPSLANPKTFQTDCRLYRYAVRFLLERICWYCRDNRPRRDVGDGSVDLVFSNRKNMSYDDIRTYVDHLLGGTVPDVRLDGQIIRSSQIHTYTAQKRAGLQLVDAVASGCFHAVERSNVGYVEDRYVRTLKPILYDYRGRHLGYGLKFFPVKNPEDLMRLDDQLGWIQEVFK